MFRSKIWHNSIKARPRPMLNLTLSFNKTLITNALIKSSHWTLNLCCLNALLKFKNIRQGHSWMMLKIFTTLVTSSSTEYFTQQQNVLKISSVLSIPIFNASTCLQHFFTIFSPKGITELFSSQNPPTHPCIVSHDFVDILEPRAGLLCCGGVAAFGWSYRWSKNNFNQLMRSR